MNSCECERPQSASQRTLPTCRKDSSVRLPHRRTLTRDDGARTSLARRRTSRALKLVLRLRHLALATQLAARPSPSNSIFLLYENHPRLFLQVVELFLQHQLRSSSTTRTYASPLDPWPFQSVHGRRIKTDMRGGSIAAQYSRRRLLVVIREV